MIVGHRPYHRFFEYERRRTEHARMVHPQVDLAGVAGDEQRGVDPPIGFDPWAADPDVGDRDDHRSEERCADDVQLDDAEHATDGKGDRSSGDDRDALACQAESSHVLIGSARHRHRDGIEDLADRVGR